MTPRLATSVLVSALIRKAEADGGFAAVLAKGDATAGSIVVVFVEKSGKSAAYERVLQGDGAYSWQAAATQSVENQQEVPEFVARRRRFDPDLWVLELDIPSIERFTAEMTAFG